MLNKLENANESGRMPQAKEETPKSNDMRARRASILASA